MGCRVEYVNNWITANAYLWKQLTYLLQYSLGGNSKTLMFVMISPLQAHLSETLTSLKFATKVSLSYSFIFSSLFFYCQMLTIA